MAAGASRGGTPARIQFAYRPYVYTVPFQSIGIFEDTSTPAIVTTTGASNPTTASFSPPDGSLLVALVGGGWGTPPTNAVVSDTSNQTWYTGVSELGLTATAGGLAMIAYAYVVSAPGSITVTATFAGLSGGSLLAVRVLNNASPRQLGAGTGVAQHSVNSTTGTVNVTTTIAGSLVYGIGDQTNQDFTYTANGATTIINAYVDSTDTVSLVAWKASALTTTPGSTALGGTWATACKSNIAALEILPVTAPILSIIPPTVQVISQAMERAAFF